MKKIFNKVASIISIPIGALLAMISNSCSVSQSPPCVYGPPPTEVEMEEPTPVVYGPRPMMMQDVDTPDSISREPKAENNSDKPVPAIKRNKPRAVVYGPRPVMMKQKKDSLK